jgi:hypothetical protein
MDFETLAKKISEGLKKSPSMSLSTFFSGNLLPLLLTLKAESDQTAETLENLLEQFDVPEDALLELSRNTSVSLAAFVDVVLSRVGWTDASGMTAAFPEELKESYQACGEDLKKLLIALEAAKEAVSDDDEDEDEGSEEGAADD